MRLYYLLLCCLPLALAGQTATDSTEVADAAEATDTSGLPIDTTIYRFADEAPRFPTPCERYDTTAAAKTECSDVAVLAYVNERAGYPLEAREQNIQGTAVVSFVVEHNGVISKANILRDPGGGLGLSALRAVAEMAQEVRWRPAVKAGKPVRFQYTLPIRFRIEDPKPYVLSDSDTIYVELTKGLSYTGEGGSFDRYFSDNLRYPASGEDSCRIGQMDMQLLITPQGRVKVLDLIDYSDLGTDFAFEANRVATRSIGQWSPAEYKGRPVTSAFDVSLVFLPKNAGCAAAVDKYDRAVTNMNDAQVMLRDSNGIDQALQKMDLAVADFPGDGRFRVIRGQARMDNNYLLGACEDFTMARSLALINTYDGILPLLCREGQDEAKEE